MKSYLECVPCFMRQALEAARMASDDTGLQQKMMRRVLSEAAGFSFEQPPPVMGRRIHRIVQEETGDPDPYRRAKRRSNEMGRDLLERFRPVVEKSDRPFETALRLAIAANVIDLGAKTERELNEGAVLAEMEAAPDEPLPQADVQALREAIGSAETVLYLTDNAGEIFFDRLLIEWLPGAPEVTVAVRGGPVINDATSEDAEDAAMGEVAELITTGSATPGVVLEDCSAPFRKRFREAEVVIAKGQGNYETLSEAPRDIFFLLRVKCPVLARDTGRPVGELVVIAPEPSA